MRPETATPLGRFAALLSCVLLIALRQLGSAQSKPADLISDVESYRVFGAALSIRSGQHGGPADRVALLQETRAVTTCPDERAVPPEWRPVVLNHRNENARLQTLRPDADLGRPYSLVSVIDLRTLMRKAGYDLSKFSGQQSPGAAVFRTFPGGTLIALSAVGFDEQKSRAMVTVQYDCFPTAENQSPYRHCHEYHQLMLERHEGGWLAARSVGECLGIA